MTTEPGSYADVAECLFREFEPVHGLWTITQVVRRCRVDLEGSPLARVPGTLESLARERLRNLPVLTFPAVDQDGDEFTSVPVQSGPLTGTEGASVGVARYPTRRQPEHLQ